jgi:hypothetical protein
MTTRTRGKRGELGSVPAERSDPWPKREWHDARVNKYPAVAEIFTGDLEPLIRRHIARGHAPAEPMLDVGDSVVTIGSCFARELQARLEAVGFSSGNVWIPSGLNNTFAILDWVSWAVTGEETARGYRYDRFDDGEIREWKPEREREAYASRLAEAAAFVFTFGLAEVWEDSETGGVFWRGVPKGMFDPERHRFRLTTVAENEENVVRLVELIRSVNATAPIVLTLSPVPLKATFRDVSCVTADCVSKSVLRVALDGAMSRDLPGVHYWPSFEIVRWAGAHMPWQAYGIPDGRARHVSRHLVEAIVDAFVRAFYTPAAVAVLEQRSAVLEPPPDGARGRVEIARYRARRRVHRLAKRARRSPLGKAARRQTRRFRKKLRRSLRS